MTNIVAISDLHGFLPYPKNVPACDILLIGGDIVPDEFSGIGPFWSHDEQRSWLFSDFSEWLEAVPAKHIVGIGGNHDFILQVEDSPGYKLPWMYLDNESAFVEGLNIFGSPYSPTFGGWAFMMDDANLNDFVWSKIPNDTDILMVHGPMKGILDITPPFWGSENVGSSSLRNRFEYGELPNLKLFVSGHIHNSYGQETVNGVKFVNASRVNEEYNPVNKPIRIEI